MNISQILYIFLFFWALDCVSDPDSFIPDPYLGFWRIWIRIWTRPMFLNSESNTEYTVY
jgi:hypothetical protein